MKQLIPKYKDGNKYEPRKNSEGKYIINPNNPQDVKFLHELQGKRGAKAVNNKGNIVKGIAEAAAWVTPLGDAEDVISIYQDTKKGNYGSALLTAGLLFPSLLIPGNLNKGRKLIKKSTKSDDLPFPPPIEDDLFIDEMHTHLGEVTPLPNYTYDSPPDLTKYKSAIDAGLITPQKPEYYRDYKYGFRILGDYNNPRWKQFHDLILAPNYKKINSDYPDTPQLPKVTPKLVDFSNESKVRATGLHYGGDNEAIYIGTNSSKPIFTGVHEYISHGTDNQAWAPYWKYAYIHPELKVGNKSDNWYEQRASLNEVKFGLWEDLSNSLERPATLEEFRNAIDNTSDNILLARAYNHKDRSPINGYTVDYALLYDKMSPEQKSITIKNLRRLLKYGYGIAGVSLVGNNLLPKEQNT